MNPQDLFKTQYWVDIYLVVSGHQDQLINNYNHKNLFQLDTYPVPDAFEAFYQFLRYWRIV